MGKNTVLFWIAAFLSAPLFGQVEYRMQRFSYTDGLPSDAVNATQVAASGYLYVATQRGISLYDGYRFIKHPVIKTSIKKLYSHNDTLYFDDEINGLSKLSSFYAIPTLIIKNSQSDSDPNNDHFDNIFIDSRKRIWQTDFNQIKYFSLADSTLKTFVLLPGNKDLGHISIFEPRENEIWVAAPNGLWTWNGTSSHFVLHPLSKTNKWQCTDAIQLTNKNVLLATTDGKIIQLNPFTDDLNYLPPLPHNEVVKRFNHQGKRLFFQSSKHLYEWDFENKNYTEIYDAKDANINSFFIDRTTQILWISTSKGLVKLTPVNPAFGIWKIPVQREEENPVISIVEQKDNELLALTKSGELWLFENGKTRKIHEEKNTHCYTLNKSQGKTFLATEKGILLWNDTHFQKLDLPNLSIKSPITKVLITPQDELWIVFSSQPIKRYGWPDLSEISQPFTNDETFWSANKWNDIGIDKRGEIWLVGWTPKGYGIMKYLNEKHFFSDISTKSFGNRNGDFVGDYFLRMALTNDNSLLFSAYGGFNRTDENGKIIQRVSIDQYASFVSSQLVGICEDEKQNVFIGTSEGLHIFLKEKNTLTHLSQADGLPTNNLTNAFLPLESGKLTIGVSNGIVLLDKTKALQSQLTNRLDLTQIRVNGKLKNSNETRIELTPKETALTLYFSDLSFLAAEKVHFRYRFEDEKEWNTLERPELSLNHIEPGNYKITIEASDNLENMQPQKLEVYVIAKPPFTKSPLFYALLTLLVCALIFSVIKYLLFRQKREEQYLHKIKEAEMKTLRTQMNPHFMFNTLNSINSYIIQNKTEDASNYLTMFSRLTRNILQNSMHTYITLENELKTLKWYMELEAARLEHSFDYRITVDDNVDESTEMFPPLIIQPFVENAIWHGLRNKKGQGKIDIRVSKNTTEKLTVTITDNGIGRVQSSRIKNVQTQHKSYGMKVTTERLKILHPENMVQVEDLYDENGNAAGTKIILTLNLQEQ